MLIINHRLQKHPEKERLGVFTSEVIREGQICWMFTHGLDHLYTDEELKYMFHSEHGRLKVIWDTLSIKLLSFSLLMGDMARFIAHSDKPTLRLDGDRLYHSMISTKELQDGEELTLDYSKVDELWEQRKR